jgi:hypothetical protein
MVIKAWGPLFVLLVLFGASLFGLFVEHPEPYNRSQPTVSPYQDSTTAKSAATRAANQNSKKGEQESKTGLSVFLISRPIFASATSNCDKSGSFIP